MYSEIFWSETRLRTIIAPRVKTELIALNPEDKHKIRERVCKQCSSSNSYALKFRQWKWQIFAPLPQPQHQKCLLSCFLVFLVPERKQKLPQMQPWLISWLEISTIIHQDNTHDLQKQKCVRCDKTKALWTHYSIIHTHVSGTRCMTGLANTLPRRRRCQSLHGRTHPHRSAQEENRTFSWVRT